VLLFGIDRLRGLLLYVNYLGTGVSMSVEKIFCGESAVFLFVFVGLFWAGLVFFGLFFLFLRARECWFG